MRDACKMAALVLDRVKSAVVVGISTYELDQIAKTVMDEYGVVSTAHGYVSGRKVFPSYICISVNEQVVHGIGSRDKILQKGDIVSLDVACRYNGFVGDNAATVMLEPVDESVSKLVNATRDALSCGIAKAVDGNRVGDISAAIQDFAEKHGYSVVRELVGHGIGRDMHEDPQIPNYGRPNSGPILKSGMTIAIEPMINLGTRYIETEKDGWTIVTKDKKPSAHFEHTILITKDSPEILTIV